MSMPRLTTELIAGAARRIAVPDGFSILPATPADLDAIQTVAEACFSYDVPERGNLRYFLTRAHAVFYVARHGADLVGYGFAEANARRRTLYVNTVCVAPAWRGHRLGRLLYAALIEVLEASGYGVMTAHVEMENTIALRLMESLGFVVTERIDHYYYDNGKSALKMRLLPKRRDR